MNTIQKLLLLLLSVPCAYGMEQSPDQTKSPQQLPLRFKVANYVVGAGCATADGAVQFIMIGVELWTVATISRLLDNGCAVLDKAYHRLPYVRLGAAVGLASFVYKKHHPIINAAGKRVNQFVSEQINKPRDWQMLDEQLAANNTF